MCKFDQRSEYSKVLLSYMSRRSNVPMKHRFMIHLAGCETLADEDGEFCQFYDSLSDFCKPKSGTTSRILPPFESDSSQDVCKQKVVISVLKQQTQGAHHHLLMRKE